MLTGIPHGYRSALLGSRTHRFAQSYLGLVVTAARQCACSDRAAPTYRSCGGTALGTTAAPARSLKSYGKAMGGDDEP
jgi:hypothetical protein